MSIIQCGQAFGKGSCPATYNPLRAIVFAGKSPNRTKCSAGTDPAGNDSASTWAYIPDKEVFVVYQALGKP